MSAAVRAQAPMTAAFSAERSRSSAGSGLSWAPLWLPGAAAGSAGRRLPFSAAPGPDAGSWLPCAPGAAGSSAGSSRQAPSSSSGAAECILPGSGRRAEPRKAAPAGPARLPERHRLPRPRCPGQRRPGRGRPGPRPPAPPPAAPRLLGAPPGPAPLPRRYRPLLIATRDMGPDAERSPGPNCGRRGADPLCCRFGTAELKLKSF